MPPRLGTRPVGAPRGCALWATHCGGRALERGVGGGATPAHGGLPSLCAAVAAPAAATRGRRPGGGRTRRLAWHRAPAGADEVCWSLPPRLALPPPAAFSRRRNPLFSPLTSPPAAPPPLPPFLPPPSPPFPLRCASHHYWLCHGVIGGRCRGRPAVGARGHPLAAAQRYDPAGGQPVGGRQAWGHPQKLGRPHCRPPRAADPRGGAAAQRAGQ